MVRSEWSFLRTGGGSEIGIIAAVLSVLVTMGALAQVPIEEKEETKPPKLRADLPLLPPLELLAKGAVAPLGELLLEAERTQHPAIRDLLRRLGYPHDRVVLRDGKVLRVFPLARKLDVEKSPQLKVQVLDATGQVERSQTILRETIQSVDYFESFAVQEVQRLAQEAPQLKPPLTRSQVLQLASFVLEQVQAFHAEAAQQGIRSDGWEDMTASLKKQERQIRIERLQALQQEGRFEEALQWADKLLALYPGDAEMVGQFRQLTETTAERALARRDFATVRRALDRLRHRLPGTTSPAMERYQRVLQDQAEAHLKEAQKLQAGGNMVAAWLAAAEAARLFPSSERVQLLQRQLLREYPFLIVAVPELPHSSWPGAAAGLPEQMAVALLYEWFVEPRLPPLVVQGYWSSLGMVPFRDRGTWLITPPAGPILVATPTGERALQLQDIRYSLEYAGEPTHLYYDPRWDKRWAKWVWREDDFGQLRLEREPISFDLLQPLYVPLIISPNHPQLSVQEEAKKPKLAMVLSGGTGPYELTDQSETEWVFRARAGWSRPHAPDGPVLREIRFRRYTDVRQAHEDLECGAVHLVVGLTAREADLFTNIPHARTVCLARQEAAPTGVSFTPRIAMIAFNRRRPAVANAVLRRAISAAIDRDSLLRTFLRGRDPTTYRLNGGPVPLASWAYHPDYSPVIRSPYRPAVARELFQQLRLSGQPEKTASKPGMSSLPLAQPLTLWVIAQEPNSLPIAQGIAQQLSEYGVKFDIRLVSRQELLGAWQKSDPPYDALLWVAEYPHEGLTPFRWLTPPLPGRAWPDPFGLADDPMIAELRQRYLQANDPALLRTVLHQLHVYLVEQAWIVPLWEMDSFVAIRQNLRVGRFHPLWVLHHVETWSWN